MRPRRDDDYDDNPEPKKRGWLSATDWQAIIGGILIWASIAAIAIWALD